MKPLRRFLASDGAATAIEYGLIAALIAIVIMGSVSLIGTKLSTLFANIAGYF